jgi:tetratricopeptide (TPR) repeat protein
MGYYRAGDRESAERELLALRGTHLEFAAFQNLGVLATDAGDFPAALAYFQEAARINPDPAILNAVGSTYMVMEAWDDAIVEFERVLGMRPAYGPAALNLATAREALGDNLGAQAVLATFAERYPTSPYMPQVRERLAARD